MQDSGIVVTGKESEIKKSGNLLPTTTSSFRKHKSLKTRLANMVNLLLCVHET